MAYMGPPALPADLVTRPTAPSSSRVSTVPNLDIPSPPLVSHGWPGAVHVCVSPPSPLPDGHLLQLRLTAYLPTLHSTSTIVVARERVTDQGYLNADGFGLGWYPLPLPASRSQDQGLPCVFTRCVLASTAGLRHLGGAAMFILRAIPRTTARSASPLSSCPAHLL